MEMSEKNQEIARLTELVSELECKAMKMMQANENLKEEHVRPTIKRNLYQNSNVKMS